MSPPPSPGRTLPSYLPFLLKAAVTAALVALLLRALDWQTLAHSARRIRWEPVALAIALNAVLQVLNAWKVRLLLPFPGPSLAGLARVNLLSLFFGTFVPGGVGGEVARWVWLARAAGSQGRALAAILLDRLTNLWAQVLLVLVAAAALIPSGSPWAWATLPAALLVLVASFWLGGLGYRGVAGLADRALLWLARRRGEAGTGGGRLGEALGELLSDRGRLLRVAAASVVYQGLVCAAFLLLDRALGGALGWREALLFLFAHTLLLLLPVTLGGWGLSEGVLGALYHYAGSGSETGVLLALLLRLMQLPYALAGGAVFLFDRAPAAAAREAAP